MGQCVYLCRMRESCYSLLLLLLLALVVVIEVKGEGKWTMQPSNDDQNTKLDFLYNGVLQYRIDSATGSGGGGGGGTFSNLFAGWSRVDDSSWWRSGTSPVGVGSGKSAMTWAFWAMLLDDSGDGAILAQMGGTNVYALGLGSGTAETCDGKKESRSGRRGLTSIEM